MIVELQFLTGRYHATPWGRHVNEAVPEWPPSPFRLVRALLDAWYRRHRDEIPAEQMQRIAAALSTPPRYALPPARASHTRSYLSQNSEESTDKKLVFDGFVVTDKGARCWMEFPGAELSAEDEKAAESLLGSLNYLGRSESWVDARLARKGPEAWNCNPVEQGEVSPGMEVISVAGVLSPTSYDERPFTIAAKGRKAASTVPWLDVLGWGSAEVIQLRMNRPPALLPLMYLRPADALSARPPPISRVAGPPVEAVRFALQTRVKVPVTEALSLAEGIRRNLLGSLKRVHGADYRGSTFTGKDERGEPLRDHQHASFLCLDEDADGHLDAVLIRSPRPLSREEQAALDGIRPVHRRSGFPVVLTPQRYGTVAELFLETRTVRSLTPFAPWLHWKLKRDGPFEPWLRAQVERECEERGLPRLERVEPLLRPQLRSRRLRWLDFRRSRKEDAPRPAFGLRLTFAAPVRAPLSLGAYSHFGLGCFIPDKG